MKGLRTFLQFLIAQFLQGKTLTATGISDWVDYDTKQILGTKVEVTITADNTAYPTGKTGQQISNIYEKFYIKVPKKVSVPIGSVVVPVNPAATIYGDYQNKLSVRADDIKVVQPTAGPAPAHTPAPTGKALS